MARHQPDGKIDVLVLKIVIGYWRAPFFILTVAPKILIIVQATIDAVIAVQCKIEFRRQDSAKKCLVFSVYRFILPVIGITKKVDFHTDFFLRFGYERGATT